MTGLQRHACGDAEWRSAVVPTGGVVSFLFHRRGRRTNQERRPKPNKKQLNHTENTHTHTHTQQSNPRKLLCHIRLPLYWHHTTTTARTIQCNIQKQSWDKDNRHQWLHQWVTLVLLRVYHHSRVNRESERELVLLFRTIHLLLPCNRRKASHTTPLFSFSLNRNQHPRKRWELKRGNQFVVVVRIPKNQEMNVSYWKVKNIRIVSN
jgi:hypothetical protein